MGIEQKPHVLRSTSQSDGSDAGETISPTIVVRSRMPPSHASLGCRRRRYDLRHRLAESRDQYRHARLRHAIQNRETGGLELRDLNLLPGSRHLEYMADMMRHPITRNGLSDAGAHVGAICDAHMSSWNLAFWGRDRTRGGKVALETIVNKQTRGPAEVYGLLDRGLLQPGMRADVNVIDFERLSWPAPHIVYDLPEYAKRFCSARWATTTPSAAARSCWSRMS